jgi:hypothetical protein
VPQIPVFAIVTALFSLAVTLSWLVIGWRAMKAHETLAENAVHLREELRKIAVALPPPRP